MKKILSFLFALTALVVFTTVAASANASEALTDEEKEELVKMVHEDLERRGYTEAAPVSAARARASIDVPPEVLELAYSDLETASPEKKQEILEARNQVIYSAKNWYVDEGGLYFVSIDENTKTWRQVPKFSELFPGWDPPCAPAPKETSIESDVNFDFITESTMSQLMEGMASTLNAVTNLPTVNGHFAIPKTVSGVLAEPFYRRDIDYKAISFRETITSLSICPKIDLGISNVAVSPYQDIYWDKDLLLGGGLEGVLPRNQVPRAGFRGSCNSTAGSAGIKIDFWTLF